MSVNLLFELYKDNASSIREKTNIQFIDIENLIMTANAKELLDNRNAGNINYAYIKLSPSNKKYRFIIYLIDGLMSFDFSTGKIFYL